MHFHGYINNAMSEIIWDKNKNRQKIFESNTDYKFVLYEKGTSTVCNFCLSSKLLCDIHSNSIKSRM